MNIKAELIKIFDEQQITEKFRKREFVVKYKNDTKYPELIKLELQQDGCNKLDDFNEGEIITIDFDLRGRAWTNPEGKVIYFNTIVAYDLKPFVDVAKIKTKDIPEKMIEEDDDIFAKLDNEPIPF